MRWERFRAIIDALLTDIVEFSNSYNTATVRNTLHRMGMLSMISPRLAPSTRTILTVLEENKWITLKEIVEKTNLPPRTVKYAIKQLKDIQILEEKPNWDDLRSKLLRLSPGHSEIGKLF